MAIFNLWFHFPHCLVGVLVHELVLVHETLYLKLGLYIILGIACNTLYVTDTW